MQDIVISPALYTTLKVFISVLILKLFFTLFDRFLVLFSMPDDLESSKCDIAKTKALSSSFCLGDLMSPPFHPIRCL